MSSTLETLQTEVLIVGAGVLGLCTAAELTRRGHQVRVLDPGGQNASSVAAGMIAPALESAIDDVTPERAALFREARAVWISFAADHGLDLSPGPAIWRGAGIKLIETRLADLGFVSHRTGDDLSVPLDVQIDPELAMARLRAVLKSSPLVGRAGHIARGGDGWHVLTEDLDIRAATVVLATGADIAVPGLPDGTARLLSLIQPIRGQIGRTATPLTATVTRGRGVYVVPSGSGSVIGATMEPDRRDQTPDAKAGAVLLEAAAVLVGGADPGPVDWRVGVRGSTPDGLPITGPSGEPDLHLALAPRRNGWLLGPLVARVVADGIEGRDVDGGPGLLDPARFASSAR